MNTLLLSYFALFDTRNTAPKDIMLRLSEICPDVNTDNILNTLVIEEKIRKDEYNYRFAENVYTITPKEMIPTLCWLFDTEDGHATLDKLKPLYAKYDMEQSRVQTVMTDFIRSRYTNPSGVHTLLTDDAPYIIPIIDDRRFIPLLSCIPEAMFSSLIGSTLSEAYADSRLLSVESLYVLTDTYHFTDTLVKYQVLTSIDLYAYLAYGYVDENRKRNAKIPETHLLSAVYEAYHGRYAEALAHFREAQRLYNARTALIDMRGIFPQPIINTIYILTCMHLATDDSMRQLDLMIRRKETIHVTVAKVLAKILRNSEPQTITDDLRRLFLYGKAMDQQWAVLLSRFANRNDVMPRDALNSIEFQWFVMKEERLLSSIHRQQPWEITLDALMSKLNAAATRNMAAPERQVRVAYYIEDIFSDLAVPRLQNITKNGGWSVGKVLPYHQYMSLANNLLLPGDLLIRQRNQNMGYINDYKLTLSSILPEMTTESRLYVGKYSPYTLVTVTEEIPYLVVERTEGGFEVKSNVRIDDVGQEIIVTSRGASSINYLRMTDEQRPFFSHLLSMPFFPSEAEGKLSRFLETLGKKVEIHSPLIKNGTTLATLDGTSAITIQMRPRGKEGYEVSIFCRPLEDGRVQCRPGEGSNVIIDQRDGRRYCVTRNMEKERTNAAALNEFLIEGYEEHQTVDAFVLLPLIDFVRERQEQYILEWPDGHPLHTRKRSTLSQWQATLKKNQNGWFELDGKLQIDNDTFLTIQQLMALMEGNTSRYIKLGDGEFMELSESLRQQLLRIDALASRSRGHLQLSAFTAALLDKSVTDGELIIDVDEELREVRQRIIDLSEYKPNVPATLQATLRSYQKEGFQWMARLNEWGAGALLADDMGLGKTVQTIAYLLTKADEGPQLVVAPASVAPNWLRELERFAPSLNVSMLNFSPNRSLTIATAGKGDVVVTTYALLLSVKQEITQKEWVTACLDEAHVIKNRGAKTSGVCMKLKAKNRIMLTGTPLQNHLGELWNLFQFVNPGLLGTYEDYGRRFVTPIEVGNDKLRRKELERIVKPFMLRRTKEAVLSELPEKTEIYQLVEMTPEEIAVYEVIRNNAEQMLLSDEQKSVSLTTLAEITKLRQAACSAQLIDSKWKGKISKIEALVEALEPIIESGDCALVFSQFTSFLALVRDALDKASIPYLYIDGTVPVKERDRLVEMFQSSDKPFVFLISLKAGGLGLNLTRANYVFHLDPWWNPAIEQQATDRAYRIGQQNAVTVYHFLSAHTIEEKIRRLHERKRDLSESILSDTDMSVKLTGEELLALVKE